MCRAQREQANGGRHRVGVEHRLGAVGGSSSTVRSEGESPAWQQAHLDGGESHRAAQRSGDQARDAAL